MLQQVPDDGIGIHLAQFDGVRVDGILLPIVHAQKLQTLLVVQFDVH